MLRLEQLVDYCMAKPGVTQGFPFDKKTMVFKLFEKIFIITDVEKWQQGHSAINLKNDPQRNEKLRDDYASIIPGFHMNKKHWNTINIFEGELEDDFIFILIDESYEIIKSKLPKKYQKTRS